MILVFVFYLLMAGTFTLAKAALSYANPFFFIGARMMVGGCLLLGFLALRNVTQLKFNRDHARLFAQITLFHIYGAYVFEFIGLQYVSSAKTCLLFNLIPFVTALISYFTVNERLHRHQWGALIMGFLAFIPVLIATAPAEELAGSFFYISTPEICILISVVCSSLGWIAMGRLVKEHEYSPLMVNGFGMVTGGVLSLLSSFLIEGFPTIAAKPEAARMPLDRWLEPLVGGSDIGMFILYMLLLILIANVFCYNLYGHLLKIYPATLLAFAGTTSPLFAAFYGWLFLNETVSVWFFVSVALVFLALYLFMRSRKKPDRE